jgi:hypothetical protein
MVDSQNQPKAGRYVADKKREVHQMVGGWSKVGALVYKTKQSHTLFFVFSSRFLSDVA